MPQKTGIKIRQYLRDIGAKDLRFRFREMKPFIASRMNSHSTADPQRIKAHGKLFLASFPRKRISTDFVVKVDRADFESSIGIAIKGLRRKMEVKLGFTPNTVIVEAIQGDAAAQEVVEKLNRELKKPWPNFLLEEVEKHAAGLGFRFVAIRDPKSLHYYDVPLMDTIPNEDSRKIHEKVNERIKMLMRRVQKGGSVGLTREEWNWIQRKSNIKKQIEQGGFLKNGTFVARPPELFWDLLSIELVRLGSIRFMQQQIKNFYYRVATGNGYERKGQLFVKKM